MGNPSAILHSDGMGGDATEEDYDAYTAYVRDNIDEACGFEVDVSEARFGDSIPRPIRNATEEQADAIREALAMIWDAWCSEGVSK